MHSVGEVNTGVPAFLAKLWKLVGDSATDHLISWSSDGRAFIIRHQAKFAQDLLPLNYKHNNMASFVRQLNMYGFHKVTSVENGALRFDRDEIEFSHPCFIRNCPHLLEQIKRKIATSKILEPKGISRIEDFGRIMTEVKTLKGRQEGFDARVSTLKQENKALWGELASLRQKHSKQQQIINKLIQFLVQIVSPAHPHRPTHLANPMNMGVKRHYQLMLSDTPTEVKKSKSTTKPVTPGGPVIHELSPESHINEEIIEDIENENYMLVSDPSQPAVESPYSEHGEPSPETSRQNDEVESIIVDILPEEETNFFKNPPINLITKTKKPIIKIENRKPIPLIINPNKKLKRESRMKRLKQLSINNDNKSEAAENDALSFLLSKPNKNIYDIENKSMEIPDMLLDSEEVTDDVPSPLFSGNIDLSNENNEEINSSIPANDMQIATVSQSNDHQLNRLNSVEDFVDHLDGVQNGLDSLRQYFKDDEYGNALMGVRAGQPSKISQKGLTGSEVLFKLFDDPMSYGLSINPADLALDDTSRLKNVNDTLSSGSELMAYNPSQLDLTDFFDNEGNIDDPEIEAILPDELNTPQISNMSSPKFNN